MFLSNNTYLEQQIINGDMRSTIRKQLHCAKNKINARLVCTQSPLERLCCVEGWYGLEIDKRAIKANKIVHHTLETSIRLGEGHQCLAVQVWQQH